MPGSEQLYEDARSAGLSHQAAVDVAMAGPTRGAISGTDWGPTAAGPTRGEYTGPAPTIDSALWLRKVGISLWSPPIMRRLVAAGLPIVVNCRVRLDGWWHDGRLALDLQHREVGGRRVFTTARIDVAACIAHDTEWVLSRVLAHLTQRTVSVIESSLLTETDLRHVAG